MEFSFELGSFIAGLIGGAGIGSIATIKWQKRQSASGNSNIVDQSNATASGDIVGRDKNNPS